MKAGNLRRKDTRLKVLFSRASSFIQILHFQVPGASIRLNSLGIPLIVVVLFFVQLVAPYKVWSVLLVGFGGAWLFGFLWVRSLASGLQLVREMRFGWAQVGDRLEERFTLTNKQNIPALWVELIDHSDLPDYSVSSVRGVSGNSRINWRTSNVCTRRGLFQLGPTTLRAGDPFGIYTVELVYPATTSILVTPPVVPLPAIEIAAGGRAGEGIPRFDAPERTVSAGGVREYEPGDSLRWIHWRTSARRDELFVKILEGTPAGDWWLFLDLDQGVQVGEGHLSTSEHGIILTASIADRGLRMGKAVGLVTQGKHSVWLPPKQGDGQRWEVLRSLALLEPGSMPLKHLLTRAKSFLRQRSSLVIITAALDGAWVEGLLPLLWLGVVPTILVFDPEGYGGSGNVNPLMDSLSRLGVTRYVIPATLLDRPEARPGKSGQWEWRITPSGKAIPVRPLAGERWRKLT